MPPKYRRVAPSAVLFIAAFIAVLPMLRSGPSCGHDFDFHLVSWLEAANQLAHFGYPHWAYTPAFNAGEPRFIFYPPLSWTLGALLGLILPWNLVPIAFTWIALTLSGLTMHALARRYAVPNAALLAATLYLANPYMLFNAYERTAYGELLAAAWLPLLFAAILPTRDPTTVRLRILPIAIPLALLWLTNAPAAVMSSYALAFLTLLRLAQGISVEAWGLNPTNSEPQAISASALVPRLPLALTATAGTLLGLALAAFYIIPAAYEQRFVQVNMAVIPGMRVSDHFLFHKMGGDTFDDHFHDLVVRTASLTALTLLAAIAILFLFLATTKKSRQESPHFAPEAYPRLASTLIFLALLIAFLLTPPSLVLWTHIPKLAFLQFPWRLTAILAVILATLAAVAFSRLQIRLLTATLASLLLAAALVLPTWHLYHQRCFPEDTVPARVALFHSNLGTEATDEYTPINIDGDALQPNDPPFWLLPAAADPNAPAPPNLLPGPAPTHLLLNPPTPELLVLNLRQYPAWHARLNGSPLAPIPQKRRDGLSTYLIPAGPETLDLTFTRTPDRTLGLALSLCALIFMIAIRRNPPAFS